MTRNLLLFLAILILGGLIYFLQMDRDKKSHADESTRDFKIENTDEIAKIFVAQKGQASLTFTRENGTWMINDRYKANQNAMLNVMRFFKANRIKFIPSQNATNNIIKEISMIGIKVEAYDDADNLLKSFYIGGNTPDERGTYFLMEHASQPYVLEMPSAVAVLRERFSRTFDEWRAYAVFERDVADLEEISVEYPKQKNHSFKININNGKTVEPFYPEAVKYFDKQNNNIVDAYLEGFDVLNAEAVYNSFSKKDSISQLTPFATISLKSKKAPPFSIKLFSFNDVLKPKHTSKPMALQNMSGNEKFYGYTSDGDFYVIQTKLIKKFLRSYAYFFET